MKTIELESVDDTGALRQAVAEHGAVLVRGLGIRDAAEAEAVFRRLGPLMPERESLAPRRSYAPEVYASTPWPSHQPMCPHHELSYALEFPGLLLFACLKAPTSGGATPVADAERVLRSLPTELVRRFELYGWLLIRNYHGDVGASVAESFGTAGRREVERYCRAHAIEFEWRSDGTLRTRQRRGAVVSHPRDGRLCWFNQIAFLSEWTLDPEVREYLAELHGPDGLPFNTCFGNGDPIDAEVVKTIQAAYDKHTSREPWRPGDLMLVDNVRMAHGRDPFEGSREVVVAMAEPVRNEVRQMLPTKLTNTPW